MVAKQLDSPKSLVVSFSPPSDLLFIKVHPWAKLLLMSGIGTFVFMIMISIGAFADDIAIERATAILQNCTRPLKSSIRIFHWEAPDDFNTAEGDFGPKNEPVVYVKNKTKEFLASNGRRGFYFAADPVLSADYGLNKGTWRLISVLVPAGTTFLEVYPLCRSDEALKKVLGGKSQCAPFILDAGDTSTEETECGSIKRAIFAKLHVAGIRYGWREPIFFKKDGCFSEDSSAFILTDSKWILPNTINFFTSSTRPSSSTRLEQISIQNLVYLYGERANVGKALVWSPKLIEWTPPDKVDENTKKWMSQNLLNCLPVSEPYGVNGDQSEEKPTSSTAH